MRMNLVWLVEYRLALFWFAANPLGHGDYPAAVNVQEFPGVVPLGRLVEFLAVLEVVYRSKSAYAYPVFYPLNLFHISPTAEKMLNYWSLMLNTFHENYSIMFLTKCQ